MKIHDRVAQCLFCGGAVIKSMQPQGKFYIYNGKAVCMVCRTMRFSNTSASAMEKRTKRVQPQDKEHKEETANKKEKERVTDIAEESQRETNTKKNANSSKLSK